MIKKGAIEPSIQSSAGYFFEEEEAGGFEDAADFGYGGLPVYDVMEHSEVEDGVEVFVREGKFVDAGDSEDDAVVGVCESFLRALDLLWVEVDCVDLTCTELFQEYLHSYTLSASDVEYSGTVEAAAQFAQQRSLVVTLHECARWVVDQQLFCEVQLHAAALVIRKERTKGVTRSSRSILRPAS